MRGEREGWPIRSIMLRDGMTHRLSSASKVSSGSLLGPLDSFARAVQDPPHVCSHSGKIPSRD
jgi:hypothetical protein